jgi:hypothetical protein
LKKNADRVADIFTIRRALAGLSQWIPLMDFGAEEIITGNICG